MITAEDICKRDGCKTLDEWIKRRCMALVKKNQLDTPYTGEITNSDPVEAEVDFGRWIAKCECGGCEYVSPNEKIFYCFGCGNSRHKGKARKVKFPYNADRIEEELEKREIVIKAGTEKTGRALLSKPKYSGLSRSWKPGETVTDLKNQMKEAKARGVKNVI